MAQTARPVVTMDLANRSITRVGLLANRVMHPLAAGHFGRQIAPLAKISDLKIVPSKAGIVAEASFGSINIDQPVYSRLLGKAGVSKIDVPKGTEEDRIGDIFRVVTTRTANRAEKWANVINTQAELIKMDKDFTTWKELYALGYKPQKSHPSMDMDGASLVAGSSFGLVFLILTVGALNNGFLRNIEINPAIEAGVVSGSLSFGFLFGLCVVDPDIAMAPIKNLDIDLSYVSARFKNNIRYLLGINEYNAPVDQLFAFANKCPSRDLAMRIAVHPMVTPEIFAKAIKSVSQRVIVQHEEKSEGGPVWGWTYGFTGEYYPDVIYRDEISYSAIPEEYIGPISDILRKRGPEFAKTALGLLRSHLSTINYGGDPLENLKSAYDANLEHVASKGEERR